LVFPRCREKLQIVSRAGLPDPAISNSTCEPLGTSAGESL
jgi:hypothetical protein